MTIVERMAKVRELQAKDAVHLYDDARAQAVIDAGTIPEGYVVLSQINQIAKYEAGQINVYTDGKLTRSIPAATGTPDYERTLIAYAVRMSQISQASSMGTPKF